MNPETLLIPIHPLAHGLNLPLPERATPHAAGMDLRAAIPEGEVWILKPGERRLFPTGFAMAIPEGYEGQVRPRSGLALRHGVTVLNSPGTIDADYRNEVMVVLINHGQEDFHIHRSDRIAQLLIAPVTTCNWYPVQSHAELGETERGLGGYGSTGKK